MKTSTEVTGNLFASLTYSRTLDALLTHFFIYKPVIFRCLCQITESIQHNQFAKQPSTLASRAPISRGTQPGAASRLGLGPARCLGRAEPGPLQSAAVAEWCWGRAPASKSHRSGLGASPGSGSPTLGPSSAAGLGGFIHTPHAAFSCLLWSPRPLWAGQQAPCKHFHCCEVLGSVLSQTWRVKLSNEAERREEICPPGQSFGGTSFPHFLLRAGRGEISSALRLQPLPISSNHPGAVFI